MSGSVSVRAVETSENAKLGPVSATYASQASCPSDCPFRKSGCYAEYGPLGIITHRLNSNETNDPRQIAREEAKAIDQLSGRNHLRLHVVGDARTNSAARILSEASERYSERGGMDVWTYTHAWTRVHRSSWGSVSVLASCESPEQVGEAHEKGYATALVVESFRQDAAYDHQGIRILPCPAQTRGVTCSDCGLCLNDNRLRESGLTIAFAAHGAGRKRVAASIPVLQ
jgi:hypothetical protein